MKTIKWVLTFLGFSILFSVEASAQRADSIQSQEIYRNSIYAEAFGTGILPTINYERLFPVKVSNLIFAIRVGGLFIPGSNENREFAYEMVNVTEFSIISGKKLIKFEGGFGMAFYSNYYPQAYTDESTSGSDVVPSMRLGARWQMPGKRFLVRLAFTPLFFGDDYLLPPVMPFGGLSIGYSFGKK